jgi:asparagine synthase (glutamine-hydrolysing)
VLNEPRRGLPAADWYLRIAPYREKFAEAVERIGASATARLCLDLPRMRSLIDKWPQDGWTSPQVNADYRLALCRGVGVGQFICRMEEAVS